MAYFKNLTPFPTIDYSGTQWLTSDQERIAREAEPYKLHITPDNRSNYSTQGIGILKTASFPFSSYYNGEWTDLFFTATILGTEYTIQVMENYYSHSNDFTWSGNLNDLTPYDYLEDKTAWKQQQSGRSIHTNVAICRTAKCNQKPSSTNYTNFAIFSVPVADQYDDHGVPHFNKWVAGVFHKPFTSSNFNDPVLNKERYIWGITKALPYLDDKYTNHLGILKPVTRPLPITGTYDKSPTGLVYKYRVSFPDITTITTSSNVVNYVTEHKRRQPWAA